MLKPDPDAAAVRLPPPFVYAGSILAGGVLQRYVWTLPLALSVTVRAAVVALLVAVSFALMGSAFALFRRTGQNTKPWKPTPEVIATGIYSFTRNPMYIAMALLQAAVGVWMQNGWVVVLVPMSLALVYLTAVRHEEAYLERKFGDVYREYKASVGRWI